MKCIIVEDEQNAAEHLAYVLKQIRPDVEIEAILDSVYSTVIWLNNNTTDLIFLDIHLTDGLSFNIFNHIDVYTPIIFTTSYDQYAIDAFKLNSIAYILKPIDKLELSNAFKKIDKLNSTITRNLALIANKYQHKFLIESGNVVHSFNDKEIAYISVLNRHVFIVLENNTQLLYNTTMDAIEQRLDPEIFFRINRQFIINKDFIHKMTSETRGRVRIETNPSSKDEMIVSIDRAAAFKEWMKN